MMEMAIDRERMEIKNVDHVLSASQAAAAAALPFVAVLLYIYASWFVV